MSFALVRRHHPGRTRLLACVLCGFPAHPGLCPPASVQSRGSRSRQHSVFPIPAGVCFLARGPPVAPLWCLTASQTEDAKASSPKPDFPAGCSGCLVLVTRRSPLALTPPLILQVPLLALPLRSSQNPAISWARPSVLSTAARGPLKHTSNHTHSCAAAAWWPLVRSLSCVRGAGVWRPWLPLVSVMQFR